MASATGLLALEEAGESATARVAALEALVADNAALTDEVAGLRDRLAATEDALTARAGGVGDCW